jgi:NAD-dependent SIR2 family protein deacetylase
MGVEPNLRSQVRAAAAAIAEADGLLIGAGAGMGVDSGLPDFRGAEGFWQAYPPFRGRDFSELSNPATFRQDERLAWGFFGHRLALYRSAVPHAGFGLLQKWAAALPGGGFVFTSNVDGQFQKAGFAEAEVYECHGSIHHLQCVTPCSEQIWAADDLEMDVDMESIRARSPLPRCPQCGRLARPNILMFGDWQWISRRADAQLQNYRRWLRPRRRIVAVEIGAGTAIPTVRQQCADVAQQLIRINPRDSQAPAGAIALPMGGLAALQAIDAVWAEGG